MTVLADAYYWDRYWKKLTRDERLVLADYLLDRDSGEVDWVSKDNFADFPKFIQDALLHKGNYRIADEGGFTVTKVEAMRNE